MKGLRFTIRGKIIWGFLTLILVFTANATYVVYTLFQGNQRLAQSQMVITPISDAVRDFTNLVKDSKMYTTNWVYLQTNEDDKNSLKAIHDHEYVEVKNRILQYADQIEFSAEVIKPDSIFLEFDELLAIQKDITLQLARFEGGQQAPADRGRNEGSALCRQPTTCKS